MTTEPTSMHDTDTAPEFPNVWVLWMRGVSIRSDYSVLVHKLATVRSVQHYVMPWEPLSVLPTLAQARERLDFHASQPHAHPDVVRMEYRIIECAPIPF